MIGEIFVDTAKVICMGFADEKQGMDVIDKSI
jgi:hypothetical protein